MRVVKVKVRFCGRSSSLDDFKFVTSLIFVIDIAISSVLVELYSRHNILKLFVQISW